MKTCTTSELLKFTKQTMSVMCAVRGQHSVFTILAVNCKNTITIHTSWRYKHTCRKGYKYSLVCTVLSGLEASVIAADATCRRSLQEVGEGKSHCDLSGRHTSPGAQL